MLAFCVVSVNKNCPPLILRVPCGVIISSFRTQRRGQPRPKYEEMADNIGKARVIPFIPAYPNIKLMKCMGTCGTISRRVQFHI